MAQYVRCCRRDALATFSAASPESVHCSPTSGRAFSRWISPQSYSVSPVSLLNRDGGSAKFERLRLATSLGAKRCVVHESEECDQGWSLLSSMVNSLKKHASLYRVDHRLWIDFVQGVLPLLDFYPIEGLLISNFLSIAKSIAFPSVHRRRRTVRVIQNSR
jgi:hypothetical protein